MKSFKDFIKSKVPTLILAQPRHGSHSLEKSKEPTVILAQPTHGAHSKLKESITESSYDKWGNHNDNHHLGEAVTHVHDKLNMPDDEFKSHPNKKHIKSYTENSSYTNRELIHKSAGNKTSSFDSESITKHFEPDEIKKLKRKHRELVKGLDETLKNSKLKHDLHVYHGTNTFNPGEEAAKNTENKIKMPAYTSTSISKHTAHGFCKGGNEEQRKNGAHIIHIHLKAGQHAHYIGSHSDYPEEHEALLPRNTTLKIHPKPDKLSNGLHVWHAHVTDDK